MKNALKYGHVVPEVEEYPIPLKKDQEYELLIVNNPLEFAFMKSAQLKLGHNINQSS